MKQKNNEKTILSTNTKIVAHKCEIRRKAEKKEKNPFLLVNFCSSRQQIALQIEHQNRKIENKYKKTKVSIESKGNLNRQTEHFKSNLVDEEFFLKKKNANNFNNSSNQTEETIETNPHNVTKKTK